MAKSIEMHELEAPRANSTGSLSRSTFWEHWFDSHTQRASLGRPLDEHGIWEKAVKLEVLAMEEKKY